MEVDAQDFGTAAADDAEQTVHTFTLSFNSAAYEEHGDHIDVAYMNGEHSIQALLKIAGRDEALMSNVMLVEFANEDGYMVTADLGENSMLDDGGRMWYGGPTNGHIVISALAVSYSGDETGAVTIGLEMCDAEAVTITVMATQARRSNSTARVRMPAEPSWLWRAATTPTS